MPFALWNKTSFLAEKVLGNVVSAGIKVLVLAVIVGIGSGLFAEFQVHPNEPSIDHALVIMLASLTLLALGIFGPGIATGLVSGAPQLGAGAMAGAAIGAAGTAVVAGAAATGVGGAVMAGARMAPAAAKLAGSGARAAASTASSARSAFQAGSAAAGGGAKGAMAGLGQCCQDRRAVRRARHRIPCFRCWATHGSPSAPAGTALLLTMARRPVEPGHPARPPQARPLPAQPMRNPLGPSGYIAASNSPMPRPPPRTRCAAAMAAARQGPSLRDSDS